MVFVVKFTCYVCVLVSRVREKRLKDRIFRVSTLEYPSLRYFIRRESMYNYIGKETTGKIISNATLVPPVIRYAVSDIFALSILRVLREMHTIFETHVYSFQLLFSPCRCFFFCPSVRFIDVCIFAIVVIEATPVTIVFDLLGIQRDIRVFIHTRELARDSAKHFFPSFFKNRFYQRARSLWDTSENLVRWRFGYFCICLSFKLRVEMQS